MPKYNTLIDVSDISDSTIAMQGEIEQQVKRYYGVKAGKEVYNALKPYINETAEVFLNEARNFVNILNVVVLDESDDFDRMHEDDLTQFDLHEFDFRDDYQSFGF